MASKSFRRLARDHASLHNEGLPPNYLFHPNTHNSDTFNSLSVYLVGPTGSPYHGGIFHLDLSIPSTYPTSPPTAFFRTKVFHPNVDPATGAVCVETLKRDWTPDLTLRHVLVTIYCLLLYPNPSSALNEDAGLLVEKDYPSFERRATLWTNMHAAVPKALEAQVDEARRRGEDIEIQSSDAAKVANTTRQEKRKQEENHTTIIPDENSSQIQAPPPPLRSRRLRDRYTLHRSSTVADQAATTTTPQTAQTAQTAPPPPPPIFRMTTKPRNPTSQSTTTSLDSFRTAPTNHPSRLFTPPPSQSPPFQSFDAEPEPKPKRLRLSTSPDTQRKSSFGGESIDQYQGCDDVRASLTPEIPLDQYMIDVGSGGLVVDPPAVVIFPWLDWSVGLDLGTTDGVGLGVDVDVDMDADRHRSQEKRRWERAGGCADRYNSGCFGPRVGLLRL